MELTRFFFMKDRYCSSTNQITVFVTVESKMGVSIHWTGPLDWTTGLTFDPKRAQIGAQFNSLIEDLIPSPSIFTTVV